MFHIQYKFNQKLQTYCKPEIANDYYGYCKILKRIFDYQMMNNTKNNITPSVEMSYCILNIRVNTFLI